MLHLDPALKRDIWAVGDNPQRLEIKHLDSPRITESQFFRLFNRPYPHPATIRELDQVVKLQKIIDCPHISDRFLRIYDDHVFLRPCSIADFATPRYRGRIEPSAKQTTGFAEVRRRTFYRLHTLGLTTLDYSTHAPQVYEKQKLQIMIDELKLLDSQPGLIESLYHNRWPDPSATTLSSKVFRFVTCPNDFDYDTSSTKCICIQNKYVKHHFDRIQSVLARPVQSV